MKSEKSAVMEYKCKPDEIFTFGSNYAGRHGKGAAREAYLHYGAYYGKGFGRCGRSYAIPTKDENLNTLPLSRIKPHVDEFLEYARLHIWEKFFVTAIGTGLAGYHHKDIAPMFKDAPSNCRLPPEWKEFI